MAIRLLKALFVVIVVSSAIAWLRVEVRRALDSYFRGDTLTTPDLTGLSVDDARRQLGTSLVLEVARQTYDPKVPRGVIISQQPTPGIRVRQGKTLFLRVSKGADLQPVPEVVGMDLRKASITLRNVGLQVGAICQIRRPEAAGNTVLEQTPPAAADLGRGGRVDLLVATGSKQRRGLLPRVTGLDQETGRAVLKQVGVQRIHRIQQVRPDLPEGQVYDQVPPGGTFFEPETVVLLRVAVPYPPARKHLELTYRIPPGLSERTLLLALEDEAGRRVVHRARHLPGEEVVLDVEGQGPVRVEYYLDDLLVAEENY